MNNLFSALLPALFQAVLAMSLTAAVTALAVLAIRAVMGALRVPRAIVFLLWAVVLFRMVCPVSFSSSWSLLSLLPAAEEQAADLPGGYGDSHSAAWDPPQSQGGHQTGASGGGPAPTLAPETGGSAQPAAAPGIAAPSEPAEPAEPGWLPALSAVWALGVLALWLWSLVSWLRLRRRLSAAVRTPDGAWESDRVDSPFVLGFFPPKIYLPLGLSGDTRRYVLLHERAHIRRGDHIVKVLAFLALAVHWFNPLLWVSWFLSCRDMEAACDESVLRRSPEDIRKNYSAALLSLAAAHPLRVPLAFGENGVKGRVRGALRWKRPAAALVAAALVVLLASCYMLAANPAQVPDAAPELTLTVEGSSITLSPVTTWAEDTGNYAAEHTPTRSEILAEYGFDWGDIYYVYYTPLDDTLHLQLWFDPETGKGCGFRYVWEGADGPLAVPDIYAFGFHGATVPTEWDDPYACGLLGNADAYSVLTPWGTDGSEAVSSLRSDWSYRADGNPEAFHAAGTDESGNPVDVLDVTFSYWDDGPLLSKSYFHNQLLFGTTYFNTQMYYTSHERLAYARCYLTHGSLELFYFYDGDGDTPAYCLMLDNDGGFCFPTLFAY